MVAKINQQIQKLNEIRASEMRMSLIYQRLGEVISGPYRDSLASEFKIHASDEHKHADIAMRHIVALGGAVGTDVAKIPEWKSLNDILRGIQELEEAGIKNWQDLLESLEEDDAFRHSIQQILVTEQEHLDDSKRWQLTGDVGKLSTEAKVAPLDVLSELSDTAGPADGDVVGDARRIVVYGISPDFDAEAPIVGEAWQDETGNLFGTGICGVMLFEPLAIKMYRASSIGLDISPLSVLALRLSESPFARVEWSNIDDK